MRCSNCGTVGIPGKKFCAECGKPLHNRCSSCNSDNAPEAKFCADCDKPLAAPVSSPIPATAPVQIHEVVGERRHLTVLFCDLVGSTAIAARLDPEEWRETVAGFHRVTAAAITQFDGYVAKNLGDGVMAFFGWPQAHDNDAERAARAGLAILEAMTKLNVEPAHVKLSVRVGIDSGAVVMGRGAGSEVDVFGDTSNIASRVEGAAAPGTVAITKATHRLLAGLFVVEDLGAHELKGIEQPVQLYRVVRPSGARGRFEAAAAGGLTPFVGREDELRTLTNRWQRALEGDGQVALIIGEAGIGKSRLLQRFHEQIADTPHTWIGAGAGAFFQNTPFYPVVEMLRQFVGDTPVEDQLEQLESRLELAGLKPADAIPLIAPLLNLQLSDKYPPSTLSPEQQRRRRLANLVEWVLGSARAQPLVIATEDLHWVDPSTLELIQLLVEQGATARLLLLYTARPEFHAPWHMRAHHTQLTLNRLSANNVRTMVAQVAASKALADDTIASVIERTGGIPLFVEELTRDMLERGGSSNPREIPATLHDSLMARLDRLGPDKEVLQIGSVMGSEFSYELLQAVHPIAETDLQRALRAGTDAELLYVRGIAPDSTYQFKHALIRDAAYEALLKSRRKELHRTVAHTIDGQFPTLKETHPEVLADHYRHANYKSEAIKYFELAGERAAIRGAMVEAERHYGCALELLIELPETVQRNRQELGLLIDWGRALQAVKGYAHADTHRAFTSALRLAERLGETYQLTTLLNGLSASEFVLGKMTIAQDLAERELQSAELSRDRGLLSAAHRRVGETLLFSGKFTEASKHLDLAVGYFDDADAQRLISLGAIAPSVIAATAYLHLGFPDRVRRLLSQEAIRAARRMNSLEVGFVHMYACLCFLVLRDPSALRDQTDHLGRIVDEVPFFKTHVDFYAGQALSMTGKVEEGKARTRQGIAFWKTNGEGLFRTRDLEVEAEFCLSEGRVEDALALLSEAMDETEEVLWRRSTMLTLRADLLVRCGARAEVERAYRAAIQCARGQGGKLYELKATTHFARWLKFNRRTAEARAMLTDIYNWFTEGFDTADLKDAKALLDELGG
jgi:class 3 adenylate cyclase/tetratricopeptide (TPR) repeat protein